MDTVRSIEFVIQENPREEHDYFLQDSFPLDGEKWFCARLLRKQKSKVSLFFVVSKEGPAVSLKNAPFGGLWVEKKVSTESLEYFTNQLVLALKSMGIRELKVIQAPLPYEENSPLIHYILQFKGFRMVGMDLHYFMEDKRYIKGFLHAKLSKHKKKLKRWRYEVEVGGIKTFSFLKDVRWWSNLRAEVYDVPEDALIRQVGAYPNRYHLISIYQNMEPIGHALCVRLTWNSMFCYLSAFNPNLQQAYTAEGLLFEVIRLGESLGVDFIDFGSSRLDGQTGHEMNRLKSKFANKISNKVVWSMEF